MSNYNESPASASARAYLTVLMYQEADGDLLLLRPGEETVWYYAHEQDKVKFLLNTMYELLEKELVNYLREK